MANDQGRVVGGRTNARGRDPKITCAKMYYWAAGLRPRSFRPRLNLHDFEFGFECDFDFEFALELAVSWPRKVVGGRTNVRGRDPKITLGRDKSSFRIMVY